MRLLVLIAVVAIANSSSGLLIDSIFRCTSGMLQCALGALASGFGQTITNLGTQLTTAGSAIVESAVETGKNLLTQSAAALLGTLGQHLDKLGKRELVNSQPMLDIVARATEFLQTQGDELKEKLAGAISKLIEIAGKVTFEVKEDVLGDVDNTVDKFRNDAASALDGIRNKLKAFGQQIMLKFDEIIGQAGPKRGISDAVASASQALQGILKGISDAMVPHVNTVIKQVSDLGATIKGHATNLIEKLKQSALGLQGKLQTHVQDLTTHGKILLQHGKDALGAVKDAVSQIMTQSLDNAKGTL